MTAICTDVVLNVYDRDGTTLRGTLSGLGLSWTDVFGDEPGEARFTAKALEAAMVADPMLLREAIVKVAVNLAVDAEPTEIYAFLTTPASGTVIGSEEGAAVEIQPVGRGVLSLFADWVVMPELAGDTGLGTTPQIQLRRDSGANRWVGWMSTAWPSYDEDVWDQATTFVGLPPTAVHYDQPQKWPVIAAGAQWLYADDGVGDQKEVIMLRRTFTVHDDSLLKFYVAADRPWSLWLNSDRIMGGDGGVTVLNSFRRWVPEGLYTVAIEAAADASTTLMEAVRFAVLNLDPETNVPITYLRQSHVTEDGGWQVLGVDRDEARPGWTMGDLLLTLLAEADARGVQSAGRIVCDFDSAEDSNGDPWEGTVDRVLPVGMSGLTLLADLGQTRADFDMTPDLHLKVYNAQGSDLSATVSLLAGSTDRDPGENVLRYTWTGTGIEATTIILRGQSGFQEISDDAAEALYDKREWGVESATVATLGSGVNLGEILLGEAAQFGYSYTAEIIAVPGCIPYVDFGKGDLITGLDYKGDPLVLQVVSINGAWPAEGGPVRWTLELEEPP